MTLAAGTKLGPYGIVAPLGAGGMGEVYRARDARLGREVAIKVLPAAMADDAERMARFQREAQMLASLNHPNIASIYGLQDSGAVRALVMELVEGPTLAERIATRARGDSVGAQQAAPLPLDEALGIAKQIAQALEAAHERGIIHRDLKPANIKVTEGGTVKVLDFGLAKAFNPQDSAANLNETNSPTLSIAATQAGVILGTAAYMSPEQARGKNVDRRADIWGWWLRSLSVTPPLRWSGDLLGGSSIALCPRISPDGRTLAFQAMVDNQTQVAVMNPDSGNWTVLTHTKSSGPVQEITWSPDGSKLYFDRVVPQPVGIYTVPSLGGDERLVLKGAGGPEALPDGSLLVWRIDP